jgi:hypothetical protein
MQIQNWKNMNIPTLVIQATKPSDLKFTNEVVPHWHEYEKEEKRI